jgi:oligopeptide transport system permease protein
MANTNQFPNIPAEKFQFAKGRDLQHDSKFSTKPVSYFQGAFRRFCKNKGAAVAAVIILCLVLFAVIAPFFTPFTPAYYDMTYSYVTPKISYFADNGIHFWDGGRERSVGYNTYIKDYALAQETGRDVIMDGEYTQSVDEEGVTIYSYRYDTYAGVGFGKYKIISEEEFLDIQRYQNETGRQVLYPIVKLSDRPTKEKNKYDANIYYKMEDPKASVVRPKLDENGDIIVNYWKHKASSKSSLIAEYNSLRIEGQDGFEENGTQYLYAYGRKVDGGIEVRAEYYEYYAYQHSQVLQDGIEDPLFVFGTTQTGKDIFACLAYGARFSFIFAILVVVINSIGGIIVGSIIGYYGGKIDLFMCRIMEILGAVPSMIVITLLKYHMGSSSQVLVLLIAFVVTGWIGMAWSTRTQFYRFKNQEYVLAARTLGANDRRIMFKHIFPNGIGTLVTGLALSIPSMIYSETTFSYLGIINLEAGNTTSVGTLIAAGQKAVVANAAYVALFPCAFLILLMLSFNLFGNGLRDAFNPSLRGTED